MAETYDIVVAGAGHNSLVATAYLAKAGFRTLVVADLGTSLETVLATTAG